MEEKTKMDEFVEVMDKAFELANEIEGISKISWLIKYFGDPEKTDEIASKIGELMIKHHLNKISITSNRG